MKTFAKLSFVFCIALQSTSLLANFQDRSHPGVKNYFGMELLDFRPNGIFIHTATGNAYPLTGIQCDSSGYFIEDHLPNLLPQSARVVAVCKNCGAQYENHYPQPCENCHQEKGFKIIYIDDGY